MARMHSQPGLMIPSGASDSSLAERLERGEIAYFPVCPFSLPEGDDRQFLLNQKAGGPSHKNISYDPLANQIWGFRRKGRIQADRLKGLLAGFSASATGWLKDLLPNYASGWKLDRASFRPDEEATRRSRLNARNDLLHIDAFPTRPSQECSLLRLYVNVHPNEPRVWVTSDPFAKLLTRFGLEVGLPGDRVPGWTEWLREEILSWIQPQLRRTAYDAFMLRFHDFLKLSDEFQEYSPKRYWHFQPGSAWLIMADTLSHAVLRGRYALEHSLFIAPHTLVLPDESPAVLLRRACQAQLIRQAA